MPEFSLKRLADLASALKSIRESDLPSRVKRARMRQIHDKADELLAHETVNPDPKLCSRCREEPFLAGGTLCHPCILYYLDVLPQWAQENLVPRVEVDTYMAELMKILLDNNLIGTSEEATDTVSTAAPQTSEAKPQTSDKINLEALLVQARKLVSLLENPEFGCFTWHMCVHQTLKNISNESGY